MHDRQDPLKGRLRKSSTLCRKFVLSSFAITVLIDQLQSMGTMFDDTLAVSSLDSFLGFGDLALVTVSIETVSDDSLSWKSVSNHIIEKIKTFLAGIQFLHTCRSCNDIPT